jgi:lipopolysaccharide/colanic/teichoic acid biosynthesis glycosyltransferase
MSKEIVNSSADSTVGSSYVLANRQVNYGVAIGAEKRYDYEGLPKTGFIDSLKFYFGEYISGIFFISALFSYTFLAPSSVTRPGRMFFSMIDRFLKKMLDFFGAAVGLILSAPFFILLPIIIKLDSRGPVFYTQERIGINRRRRNRRTFRSERPGDERIRERRISDLHGRPFKVIKFRTMIHNAESATGPVWAIKNDSRITRVGRILRKTRLDEIPQLINVLIGDMSMVGPRPERPFFIRELLEKVPDYAVRLRVKPGITGLAQVTTGYDSSLESVMKKVKADITYIRRWSIWSDLKILMRTVVVVITGKGAC